MIAHSITLRNSIAHVEITAADPTPAMQSGLYDSVGQFFAVTGLHSDLDARFEKFDPSPSNEWLRPGYAAAAAYRTDPTAPTTDHRYVLATYVEGDVTRYRFTRFEDATRAGRLWAAGTPASAA
ncbi:hypothetical protein O1W71_14975 [Microbacterium sp. H37-C3]|uniref:hypothetical protein n=1 Tax=Microbacterium sp. H37-C3 TaxID=3004354 RepID=UPI0022AFA870|nr:hypothetical protein [Microbacterium sp. H37-C3]MCZ4068980.1 hypothetical protein [Microbacterium sp. H37-C3]